MATIKSFTDISQSKKLAEILPLETADMYWDYDVQKHEHYPMVMDDQFNYTCIRAWSLAALLNVIPKRIKDYNVLRTDINENDTAMWYNEIGCGVNNELPDITKETAIDACYEMIIRLNELKML